MTSHVEYRTPPITYSGPNAIEKFLELIFSESEKVNDIMSVAKSIMSLTDVEVATYDATTTCQNCRSLFDSDNPNCRHHNHVSGKYVFAACQKCNLALKPHRCSAGFVVVCLFHNLSANDSAFLLKNFDKKYTERVNAVNGAVTYDDIRAIPLNSEKTLQFQIKNVVFTDSFHFWLPLLTPWYRR